MTDTCDVQPNAAPPSAWLDPSVGVIRPPPVPSNVDGLVMRPVLSPTDLQKLTYIRTEDARTALSRGLKEYLEGQAIIWEGGRPLFFESVQSTWAEPEDPAKYPAAAVVATGDATYDASNLTPVLVLAQDGTKRYIRQAAELIQRFSLTLWAADGRARAGLVAMCEDALEPADFMTGLRLELPYYWNARATYIKETLSYEDNPADARRRWKRAVISVVASIPQYRPVGGLPLMHIQRQYVVNDGSPEVRS